MLVCCVWPGDDVVCVDVCVECGQVMMVVCCVWSGDDVGVLCVAR